MDSPKPRPVLLAVVQHLLLVNVVNDQHLKVQIADRDDRGPRPERRRGRPGDEGMETFRIEVGHNHQVKPGNIVGAIANEAGIDSARSWSYRNL